MNVSNDFAYKAKVTRHNGWQQFSWARFGISVGMPYHEGNKLKAALEWAQKRFPHVEVVVSDTLQRYNMPGNPAYNFEATRTAGDAWLSRNGQVLKTVPDLLITRWDDLLQDPSYPEYLEVVNQRLQDPKFRAAMADDMAAYIGRTGQNRQTCVDYLCEELAVFSMMRDQRPAAEVYPGSFLKCRMLLRPDFNMTRIDFVRVPKVEHHDLAA